MRRRPSWGVRLLVLSVLVAACGGSPNSGGPDANPHANGDAPGGSDGMQLDAAIDASPDGPVTATNGTALTHTLFINTEGVTVTQGMDNAVTNTSSTIAPASIALKAWLVGDSQRTTKITAVVDEIKATVAPYNISVVTTRPAAGPYDMVVITDTTSQDAIHVAGSGGIGPNSCNQTASVISMLFGPTYASTYTATQIKDMFAQYAITMFALEAAVPISKVDQDCMCYYDPACMTLTGPCKIGGANTTVDTSGSCGTPGPKMNEAAVFLATFGAHP